MNTPLKTVLAVLIFSGTVEFVRAIETDTLLQEAANLRAQTELLQAARELQTEKDFASSTQRTAAETAAATRAEEQTATLNAIAGLAEAMPSGNYTSAGGGVATPAGMKHAFENLDVVTKDLQARLKADLQGRHLVILDTMPQRMPGFDLVLYGQLIDGLIAQAAELEAGHPHVAASALIAALPGVVNAVQGLFRSDTSEAVFSSGISNSTTSTAFIQNLLADTVRPIAIYLSLDELAFADLDQLGELEIVKKITSLKAHDDLLADMLKNQVFGPQEDAVTLATAKVEDLNSKIEGIKFHRDFLVSIAKADPANVGDFEVKIEELTQQLADSQITLRELKASLAIAKRKLAEASEDKPKIVALRERIGKVMTALSSSDGSPPLFVRLVRDQLLSTIRSRPDDYRFLVLNLAASPQSSVTKKSFWRQRFYALSFTALEFRLMDGASNILQAGILRSSTTASIDLPGNP